jgi:catechol 2,3-dioxygenase-like lactoylglutathione lyase family enzyme
LQYGYQLLGIGDKGRLRCSLLHRERLTHGGQERELPGDRQIEGDALVTIVTANLDPMRTFYQQVLQIEPQIYRGNYVEFPLEAGTLALWRQSECAEFGLGVVRGTANDRVLIELEVADVDREYARLKGLQVEWVQELTTQPWGHRAFYVRDPDGNVLNLHTTVEE